MNHLPSITAPKFLTPLLLGSLLLTACGGGGGGGGGDVGSGGVSVTPPPLDCPSTEYNAYLPLAAGTAINYDNDTVSGDVSCDVAMSNAENTDIYAIEYNFTGQSLTFYLSSTPGTVEMLGLDGPITVALPDGQAAINNIRFDEPLEIIGADGSTGNPDIAASATVEGPLPVSISLVIAYTKSQSNVVYNTTDIGSYQFPAKRSVLEITIVSATYTTFNSTVILGVGLTSDLYLAESIGMVRHSHVSPEAGIAISSDISSVSGLPTPIWLDYTSAATAPTSPLNSYNFFIDGKIVTADEYSLVNASDLNALSWLDVVPDIGIDAYEIRTSGSIDLETLVLPYSVPVIFENAAGQQLYTSITLMD
ncbi:MAG: hypothetical protein SV765_14295 [Pseudomonadota bacterium]|nr:hypothetical protein [Pseudomonadota bacterium]